MLALAVEVGDIAVRTDISKTFILQVEPATTLGNWVELKSPSGSSVTNLALGTRTDTEQVITNDNGTGFTLPTATTSLAGLLGGTLKTAYDAVVAWINTNGATLIAHLSLTNNPHNVTKTQVGLSNVPNTDFTNAVALNTAKVTNATHTGEVTGSGALTVDKTAVTNKTTETPIAGDFILFSDTSDSGNLKKANFSAFGGGMGSTPQGVLKTTDPAPTVGSTTLYWFGEKGTYTNLSSVVITGDVGYLVWDGTAWKAVNIAIDLATYLNLSKTNKGGVDFASGNGYIKMPTFNYLPNASWTIQTVIKIADKNAVQTIYYTEVGKPSILIASGKLIFSKTGIVNKAECLIDDSWVGTNIFLSVTFNGTTHTVKVNNVAVTVTVLDTEAYVVGTQTALTLGATSTPNIYSVGSMVMFRIFNYALTSGEETSSFNSGFVLEQVIEKNSGLVLELLPNNLQTNKWLDSSLNSLSGSFIGGVKVYSERLKEIDFLNNKSSLNLNQLGTALLPTFNYFPNTSWSVEIDLLLKDATTFQYLFLNGVGRPSLYINAGNIGVVNSGVAVNVEFSASPFLNVRKSLVITFNGTNTFVYVDGFLITTTYVGAVTYTSTSDVMYLGNGSGTNGFKGDINLFRISNFALSGGQVFERYNYSKTQEYTLAKTSSLILELNAVNVTPTKWFDTSLNKLNASITGTATIVSNAVDQSAFLNISKLSTIPNKIYVAVGREFNLWFDSFIPYYGKDRRINVTCAKGACSERSFKYTPITTETNSMVIKVYDLNGVVLESKTVSLIAVSKTAGSGTKNLLFIGDSTTDSYLTDYLGTGRAKYEMLVEFNSLITTDGGFTPLFLGTNGAGAIKHEGRSGYDTNLFLTNNVSYPNPFWDGTRVNFQNWMSANSSFGGTNKIDFVFIQLGINDLKYSGNPQSVVDNLITLCGKINDASYGYPTAKIIISQTPYACADRTGWATAFNGAADSDYEAYISRMLKLAELIVSTFHENGTYPNVYVAPNMLFVDRYYGYPRKLVNASARDTTQVTEFTDSVHPDLSGYKQAADSFYSRLRSIL